WQGDESSSRVLVHTPSGWTTLGEGLHGRVYALAWHAGELYAGGAFTQLDGTDSTLVAHWDGARWRAIDQQLPRTRYDWVEGLASYRGELVAAGTFGDWSPPGPIKNFARWDGTRWAPLGPGAPRYPNLVRLRVVGPDLYAVGTFSDFPRGHAISRWDGTSWHLGEDSLQVFVMDVAEFNGELHAGGALARAGKQAATPL